MLPNRTLSHITHTHTYNTGILDRALAGVSRFIALPPPPSAPIAGDFVGVASTGTMGTSTAAASCAVDAGADVCVWHERADTHGLIVGRM